MNLAIAAIAALILQTASTPVAKTGPLVHEGIVNAPLVRVWDSFTSADSIKSWMAPHADIDLRVGGKLRTNYNPDGVLGDSGTIENTILSFEPLRMLSIKATKPPADFPFKGSLDAMWSVIYFETAGPQLTRLRIVGMGYDESAESQKLRDFFERGNALTLKKLQEKFAAKSDHNAESTPAERDNDSVLAHLAKFVGGEWISDNKRPDGGVFRVRNQMTFGPDGKSLVTRGWLGNADGMFEHSAAQIWRDRNPDGSAAVRFQNIDEGGSIARGEIRMHDPRTSEWSWTSTSLSGNTTRYRVTMCLETDDSYQLKIFALPSPESSSADAAPREMVSAKFQRVAAAPAEFLKLRKPDH